MEEQSTGLQKLLHNVAAYDGDFKKWEARAQKIIKRYRDDNRSQNTNETAKFNILWDSNRCLDRFFCCLDLQYCKASTSKLYR